MTDTVSDEEFSELVDATIPRLDLVGKGANGMPFLIAKSADDQVGLLPAELVRDLIRKRETGSKGGAGMARVVKAKDLSQVSDADLRRQAVNGSASEKTAALQELGMRTLTNQTPDTGPGHPLEVGAEARAARATHTAVDDTDPDGAAAATYEVAKALAGARYVDGSLKDAAVNIAKGAGTVDGRFEALLKAIDPGHARDLQNAVATGALRLSAGRRVSGPEAVAVMKRTALRVATAQATGPVRDEAWARRELTARFGLAEHLNRR